MLKRLLSVLTCTAIASLGGELLAQLPEQVRPTNSNEHRKLAPQACADQLAGSTVRSLGVGAKSNDKHFLCAGDSLMIVHQGNQNLSNDITPATPSGIGYGFYDCAPTISGQRYHDIRDGDACWNRQTILINGVSTPPLGGIWVSFGQINGNHRFVNDGRLQNYFNNNRPKKFYFAPITVDNFDDRSWNGNSCANANVRDIPTPGDTFSVVYLNKIIERNISYNYGALTGQFNVSGGLSEYDGTSNYTITVLRTSSNAIMGSVTSGAARHNSTVSISVPQSGTYTIRITDGKSCDRSFEMHFPVIELMVLNDTVPRQGDTACVKVAARGFNNIISMQSNFTFNRTLLNFVGARNFNLPNMNSGLFSTFPGIIGMSWDTPIPGATRADSTTLFELCFETLGPRGTFSDVKFSDTLGPIEVTYDNLDTRNRHMGVVTRNGGVFIGDRVFTITSRTDSVRCYNGFDGQMVVKIVGGAAPFSFNWTGPNNANGNGNITRVGDSLLIPGLATGTYTVTIRDNFGASRITSATVGQPSAFLYATMDRINLRCFGDTTGVLRISTYGGGTAPYRFSWSNSADSVGASVSRLRDGIYRATVTDARNCTRTLEDTIRVPQLRISAKNSEDAVCVGVNTGIARINNVTGGSIPNGRYVFQWSTNVQHSGLRDSITSLNPGRYFVTVSDNNNCQVKDTFTIAYLRSLALSVIQEHVTCAGQNNGLLNVTASSTNGLDRTPYTFTWSNNAGTPITNSPSSVVNRLASGTYTLTARDADNCRLDTSFVITAPDSIRIDTQGVIHEGCNPDSNGVAQVLVTGGRPINRLYRYSWNGSTRDTLRSLSNLVAGNYTVVVTDSLGCTASKTITIRVPPKPIITRIDTIRPTCYNSTNGGLIVRATAAPGGSSVFSYKWNLRDSTRNTLTNVGGGVYTVTVTDGNGCEKIDSQRVIPPTRITILIPTLPVVQLRHPSCPTRNDGQITLPVTGGAGGPYNYSYASGNSQTGAVFTNLTQGRYRFTISDRNNCSIVDSFELKDPDSIKVVFSDYQAVNCYSICNINRGDGAVTVRAFGGTSLNGKYGFEWSSNETTNNNRTDTSRAIALCQGSQWVRVTDDQGVCSYTYPVTIPARDSFRFDSLVITPPSCNGKKDGGASLKVSGGTPVYRYSWTDSLRNIINNTNSAIFNVGSGNFTLLVTDSKQCTYGIGLTIDEPNKLRMDTVPRLTTPASCYGLEDGQIGIRRTGGNAGRTTYAWSTPNGIDSLATNLSAGAYSVTATDVKGCRDSLIYTVTQPDSIYFFMQKPAPPRCNGLSTTLKVDTVYGSKRIYPFLISLDNGTGYPPGYPISTFAGTHQLTIIETTTGCTLDTTVTITEPNAVKVDFDSISTNTPGQVRLKVGLGDSIRLNPRLTNSLPIDSVVWTPNTYLSFRGDPLRPWVKAYDDITYKLTVIDANGCTGFDEVTVELERNRNVFVPNVFSPNGDDQNDFFQPFTGLGVVRVNYMRVFDRWGELMFQLQNLPASQDSNVGWDGTFRGKKADSGVYVYIMEVVFEDGQILLYRGDVNLLR